MYITLDNQCQSHPICMHPSLLLRMFFFRSHGLMKEAHFFGRTDAISSHIDKQRGSKGLGLGEVEGGGWGAGMGWEGAWRSMG